jgi:magnesium chelatase family protein
VLIEVPALNIDDMEGGSSGESSEVIRSRVVGARSFRDSRLGTAWEAQKHTISGVQLSDQARRLLRQASVKEPISGRGYTRILRVARTIADLDNVFEVGVDHIAEALSLRLDCRRVGSN